VETEAGATGATQYCVQGTMLQLISPSGGSDYDIVVQKQ
jgi:hypothetical protein